MYIFIHCFCALSIVANGLETIYPVLNFSDVKTFNDTPCPEGCGQAMVYGLELARHIFGSIMGTVPIPVNFCQECRVGGLDLFKQIHECLMNPEGDIFDHYFNITIPHLFINCICDLSNNPSIAASQVNGANLVVGECGQEKAHNQVKCPPIQCPRNASMDRNSTVKLNVDFSDVAMFGIMRVDTRDGNPTAFPRILYYNETHDEALLTHEGPTEFEDSWNCLRENKQSVVCHLLSNHMTPFYTCLSNSTDFNLIYNVVYEYGKCTTKIQK